MEQKLGREGLKTERKKSCFFTNEDGRSNIRAVDAARIKREDESEGDSGHWEGKTTSLCSPRTARPSGMNPHEIRSFQKKLKASTNRTHDDLPHSKRVSW